MNGPLQYFFKRTALGVWSCAKWQGQDSNALAIHHRPAKHESQAVSLPWPVSHGEMSPKPSSLLMSATAGASVAPGTEPRPQTRSLSWSPRWQSAGCGEGRVITPREILATQESVGPMQPRPPAGSQRTKQVPELSPPHPHPHQGTILKAQKFPCYMEATATVPGFPFAPYLEPPDLSQVLS